MDQIEVRDLIFELSEPGQPKVCIAVCDDPHGWQIQVTVSEELRSRGLTWLRLRLTPEDSDLVELIRAKTRGLRDPVCSVEGFEHVGTRPLNRLLMGLNFRRDVLFTLSVPLVLWIKTRTLAAIVQKAPDFWSRRTATYYFTHPTVRHILVRLFRERGVPEVPTDKISQALQKTLEAERELNKAVRFREAIPRTVAERRSSEIRSAIRALIDECNRTRKLQVTLSLWTLTRIDDQLQSVVSRIPHEVRARYTYLYEDRNEILVAMSERIEGFLERYLRHVETNAETGRGSSVLSMFSRDAARRVERWSKKMEKQFEQLSYEPVRLGELSELEDTEEELEARGAAPKQVEAWLMPPDAEELFRSRAAAELQMWLEGESHSRPRFFSVEEGQLLRMMYQESSDSAYLARRLGRSIEEVARLVEGLKANVHAFLGIPILAGIRWKGGAAQLENHHS